MNKFLVLVCLALLGFIAWREKAAILEWKEKAGARLEKFVFRDNLNSEDEPDAAADDPPPAPGNSAEAAPKTPPAPVKLPDPPEGVFYLRERITVKIDSGVRGYAAGTRVTKTGEHQGLVTVTDGVSPFSVEPVKLTRDMNEVLAIQTKAAAPAPMPPAPGNPAPAGAAASGASSDARNNARLRLEVQAESLDRQIQALKNQIREANGRQGTARSSGKISAAGAYVPELQKKLDQLLRDRASINAQLAALRR